MDKLLTIKQVADILNVTNVTLRTWDKSGKLPSVRTNGGHRRWRQSDVDEYMGIISEDKQETKNLPVCTYGRVSSHEQKQKGDLDRQLQRLSEYSAKNKYTVEHILKDVGSGLSDTRKGLLKLFNLVVENKISKVIIEHRDRLTRFQYNFFEFFFNSYGVKIEVIEKKIDKGDDELVEDIMMLMASFSGKIHGRRSAKRRKKNV
jgi:putative resolvase